MILLITMIFSDGKWTSKERTSLNPYPNMKGSRLCMSHIHGGYTHRASTNYSCYFHLSFLNVIFSIYIRVGSTILKRIVDGRVPLIYVISSSKVINFYAFEGCTIIEYDSLENIKSI